MWQEAKFFLFFNQSIPYVLPLKTLKVPEEDDYIFFYYLLGTGFNPTILWTGSDFFVLGF